VLCCLVGHLDCTPSAGRFRACGGRWWRSGTVFRSHPPLPTAQPRFALLARLVPVVTGGA
jgi:hypothetical protein